MNLLKSLQNEGKKDRVLRFISSIILAGIAYIMLQGALQTFAYAIAIIRFITSLTGVCPLYSACPMKRKTS